MLAVHWTPVNNTKKIIRGGIKKSKKGLYCFPLTGHKSIDRWWLYFFNQCKVRQRKKYNGVIFKIIEEDLPAYFGHWSGATNKDKFLKDFKTVKELSTEFRNILLWRMGEILAAEKGLKNQLYSYEKGSELYLELAEKEIEKSDKAFSDKLNDLDFMTYALEDYQIVLNNSIPAKRILKIIPQYDKSGRQIRQKKKKDNKIFRDQIQEL